MYGPDTNLSPEDKAANNREKKSMLKFNVSGGIAISLGWKWGSSYKWFVMLQ